MPLADPAAYAKLLEELRRRSQQQEAMQQQAIDYRAEQGSFLDKGPYVHPSSMNNPQDPRSMQNPAHPLNAYDQNTAGYQQQKFRNVPGGAPNSPRDLNQGRPADEYSNQVTPYGYNPVETNPMVPGQAIIPGEGNPGGYRQSNYGGPDLPTNWRTYIKQTPAKQALKQGNQNKKK